MNWKLAAEPYTDDICINPSNSNRLCAQNVVYGVTVSLPTRQVRQMNEKVTKIHIDVS